jgi:hypothetical protein
MSKPCWSADGCANRSAYGGALAILAGVLVLVAFALMQMNASGIGGSQQIARVSIEGLITDDRKRLQLIRKLAKNSSVKGVIFYIDSPAARRRAARASTMRSVSLRKPNPSRRNSERSQHRRLISPGLQQTTSLRAATRSLALSVSSSSGPKCRTCSTSSA